MIKGSCENCRHYIKEIIDTPKYKNYTHCDEKKHYCNDELYHYEPDELTIRQDERENIFKKIKNELWQEEGDNDYISVKALLELIGSEA